MQQPYLARSTDRKAGRHLCIPFLALALGGCPAPLMEESTDRVPQALMPMAYAPVKDGRGDFREIYCAIREDHGRTLPDDRPCDEALVDLGGESPPTGIAASARDLGPTLRVVVIPGIFGECAIRDAPPFQYARQHLEEHGYKTDLIDVKGRFGTEHNARIIADYVMDKRRSNDEKLLLIGYSKGISDALTALANHPEIRPHIAGAVSVAGVVNGTPLADGFHDNLLGHAAERLPHPDCSPGDGRAIEDISRGRRMAWLERHRKLILNELPDQGVRLYSVVTFPRPDQISAILKPFHHTLSFVDPRNDSQVIFFDTVIPNSTLLAYVAADHWAIALPFSRNRPDLARTLITRNEFPREVLLEAIVRYVEKDIVRSPQS